MSDEQNPENEPEERIVLDDGLTYAVPLPESSIPLTVVEVVEYLDDDGDHCYAYRVGGTQSVSQITGLLRVAEHHLLRDVGRD